MRDAAEKRAYSHIFEDFAKYNAEIKQLHNKNNELEAKTSSFHMKIR